MEPIWKEIFFNPTNLIAEISVTTKPLSLGALDKLILLTFSGASGATFVGDPTITTILKSQTLLLVWSTNLIHM